MKLLRYRHAGSVVAGVLIGDGVAPLSEIAPGFSEIRQIAAAGGDIQRRMAEKIERASADLALAEVELLAPIERPGKYLAIGMNYADHGKEGERLGLAMPTHQLWFNKQTSCLNGPFAGIEPGVTEKLDYEVELGVVIGRAARHVDEANAPGHVFGYFVANDVSARDWQFHSQTMTVGKSFDTHGPIGPWIVTADEIPDPHALGLRCLVNGERRQNSNTGAMIFNIWSQIAYLSTAFTLETGDLLATGTPAGVGVAMDPPRFLRRGDLVRCEIDCIGAIENRVL